MDVDQFVERWSNASGTEKANYQLFLTELTEMLGLGRPDPASQDTEENAYVFERKVVFQNPDGTSSNGFIDLYKRGCFVCEAKQTGKQLDSAGWDSAMLRAHGQAQQYARALPAAEGRPPFLIVVDVGRNIELYAEFTRTGATYVPFPDPRSHRIRLDDLKKGDFRDVLRAIWNEPLSLDPSRRSARVTREIANHLAKLAKSLEGAGHAAGGVAAFLMRALFTMFAEDVGLLKQHSFTGLLQKFREQPDNLPHVLRQVWTEMNGGSAFSIALEQRILRFNGGLFADPDALPLDKKQIDLLIEAAQADWRHVEPAIFGTLLERALDPHERHRLGAHYTPRAYVERLVMPTVIEPLRDDWAIAQATALQLDREGKRAKAIEAVQKFHHRLCHIKVLDPACGSGNFLYVTLEHLKRLEGEVLNTLDELGYTQSRLDLAGVMVDPHQMLGLETNPRAVRIAEAVLWIGYLQWHFRTRGNVSPPEPVLRDFHNIECRDAVLAWDDIEFQKDEQGKVLSRWDGRTTKTHPVTGQQVPDEAAQVAIERYVKPRKAGWPEADFIVGNPPFIGKVPATADYVMYWWHHAADLVREGKAQRFGFITTNSLRQTFNRRVLEHHLEQKRPLSIGFAIPDHPWVDSADGAAVRVAMTVGIPGDEVGTLSTLISEGESGADGVTIELTQSTGKLHSDLRIGANIAAAGPLAANVGLCFQGMNLVGKGFRITPAEVQTLGYDIDNLPDEIKPHTNAKGMVQKPEDMFVIDFFGYTAEEARAAHPALYQRLLDRVKPERDHNKDAQRRRDWWLFGRSNRDLRNAWQGLGRFFITPETAKHRIFASKHLPFCPDHKLYAICSDDFFVLGALSSRLHMVWAVAAGGRQGVGNDPVWNNTRCFITFPFPDATESQKADIRSIGERLDAHRKSMQDRHPNLTLTGMYNVLEKLRRKELLTPKDKVIHEEGLVSVLAELHDQLDTAVLEAYGWADLVPELVGKPGGTTPYPDKPEAQAEAEELLLERLVALNAERAAEEARGRVRWLRPEFQNPSGKSAQQGQITTDTASDKTDVTATKKRPWPKTLPEQMQVLRRAVAEQNSPLSAEQIARQFTRAHTKKVKELLDTLAAIGQVRELEGTYGL